MFPRLRTATIGHEESTNDQQILSYFNEVFPPTDPLRIRDFDKRYVQVCELGNGRFGAIVKLLDQSTEAFVAGKVVNTELFNHWYQSIPKIKIRIDTFLREYRKIEKLSKINDRIANFLGIAVDLRKIVILYEFAPNGNVKDKIIVEPLSESLALKYFYQTADALEFLHSQRTPVVHMDIKAANLLLSATDNVKLANFGLVRDLTIGGFGMAVASEITEDFRATLLYVAPEVLISEYGPGDRRAYSPSADIWSLGCTYVEMLTSSPPYFEYYDDCENFYTDVLSRAHGPLESQLPYDCMSLVPTASTITRFLVNKIFDKCEATRISAEGLINFLQTLSADNLHHQTKLEGEFQKAYESSQKTFGSQSIVQTASKKRGIFQSIRGLSIQSLSKIRGTDTKKSNPSLSNVSEGTLEEGPRSRPPSRAKRKRNRNARRDCWFCFSYCMSRIIYFTGIYLKSFASVASFVFLGLTALSMFFLIAFGVVFAVRKLVAQFCECDLMAPPILIISGIFVILLFGLLFSCCMVALGEYKFRVANRSLHSSPFFVRRPDKDVRMCGMQIIRGKRLVLKPYQFDSDDEAETIPQRLDENDPNYVPTPAPPEEVLVDNERNSRRPTMIVEEPSRKLACTSISPLGKTFDDLYNNEPPPSPSQFFP